MKKLAILDYGVGGFDLYRRLKEINAQFPITYFSDAGAVPYGKLDEESLTLRLQKVIHWLKNRGVEQLVIACHSASTVSNQLSGLPIINMIEATKESIKQNASSINRLGIIGGGRTIESKVYRNYGLELGMDVVDNNAQIFSIMIENDMINNPGFVEQVHTVLNPLGTIDGLLLACTHYPIIQDQLKSYYKQDVIILDPIEHLIQQNFDEQSLSYYDDNKDSIFTTGNAALTSRLASKLYGLSDLNVCHVNI